MEKDVDIRGKKKLTVTAALAAGPSLHQKKWKSGVQMERSLSFNPLFF